MLTMDSRINPPADLDLNFVETADLNLGAVPTDLGLVNSAYAQGFVAALLAVLEPWFGIISQAEPNLNREALYSLIAEMLLQK